MHTGRFKLEKETLAIGDANGKRVAVTIPAGDTDLAGMPRPGVVAPRGVLKRESLSDLRAKNLRSRK